MVGRQVVALQIWPRITTAMKSPNAVAKFPTFLTQALSPRHMPMIPPLLPPPPPPP